MPCAAHGAPRARLDRLLAVVAGKPALSVERTWADLAALVMGITFTVYSDGRNVDRTLPFDLIPRILDRREWRRTEAGLKQRRRALAQAGMGF